MHYVFHVQELKSRENLDHDKDHFLQGKLSDLNEVFQRGITLLHDDPCFLLRFIFHDAIDLDQVLMVLTKRF